MKSFRQLINEALGLFESNYAARQGMINVGREIARATAQRRTNNTPVTNNTLDIDTELDTDDNLNKILSRLIPAQRGCLIGDCINTYRDFEGANYISVFVENGKNANYFISDISNKEIKKDAKTGYINIIISRNYINKHFPIVNARDALLQIIKDLKSGGKYEFGSHADPMPHDVTKDMITNHKVFNKETTRKFNPDTRLFDYETTSVDTGETEDVIGLTLRTEMSGGGISKKEGVMSKTSQGRKTGIVSNVYYINQNPDCCVQVEGLPVYAFSLKRLNSTMYESVNLENYLIEASSSATATRGSVKNVYIRKKLEHKTIFTHSKFLSHLASTINLALRNPKTLITGVPVDNNSRAEEFTKSASVDNNSHAEYGEPTIDELIRDSRKKYTAFEAARPDDKEKLKKAYLEVANTLYKKLIKEYRKNGRFEISNDMWQRLTKPIQNGIKEYQAKYKKVREATQKAQAERRDVSSVFGRRY